LLCVGNGYFMRQAQRIIGSTFSHCDASGRRSYRIQ